MDWIHLPFPQISVFQNRCVKFWFHTLRKNYLLKHTNEEKIEGRKRVKEKRGRRLKFLLDDLKKKREYRKPEKEALDRNPWRCRVG